jgi:RNA polymerase sigma factor (sigma-70 family)
MSPSISLRLLLTQSDARLVAFAQAGHERAFEALVKRYRRPLLGYCRRLLLSEERAEDALQQALLQAWLALREGTEVGDAKPWLYRIVHNAALNVLRVSGYDYCELRESLSGADAPQADLDRRIAVREALAGLAALPEMQREALLRTAVEGRTHQQVAKDLGLSETALRGLVYRARSTMRTAAGAITPAPLVSWALASGTRGTPLVERLAEISAGGGSAGLAGLLMKGGAMAVTAGVLAGGINAGHARTHAPARHSRPHVARPARSTSTALADSDPTSSSMWAPTEQTQQQAPSSERRRRARREASRPRRTPHQAAAVAPPAAIVSQPDLATSNDTKPSRQDHAEGTGKDHGKQSDQGSVGPDGRTPESGHDANDNTRHGQPGSDGGGSGDGSGHHDSEDSSPSGERAGGDGPSSGDSRSRESQDGSSKDSSPNSRNGASPQAQGAGGAAGGGSAQAGQPRPSSDHRDSGASSSAGTNSSSKDEGGSASKGAGED